MSMLLSLFGGVWAKIATGVVAVVSVIATILGVVWRIKSGAKDEMRAEIQEQTLERIQRTRDIEGRGDLSRPDVLDKLREQGHLRE